VTLGWLVERVVSLAADPVLGDAGIAFTLDTQEERRDLVAVARLLLDAGVLARVAGDEQAFIASTGDALYDVNRRVLASMLVTRRGASTVTETTFTGRMRALVAEPRPETEEARNREIRHRLVRRLLDDPVLYYADLSEDERAYLSGQRGLLLRRLVDATGFIPEVRAEGIALLDPTGDATDLGMPEEGTDGHATLLLAEYLAAALRERPGTPVRVADTASARRSARPPAQAALAEGGGRSRCRAGTDCWRAAQAVGPEPDPAGRRSGHPTSRPGQIRLRGAHDHREPDVTDQAQAYPETAVPAALPVPAALALAAAPGRARRPLLLRLPGVLVLRWPAHAARQ